MDRTLVRRPWRAALAPRAVRAALATVVAAPLFLLFLLLPVSSAAADDDDGYAPPPVETVVLPAPPPPTIEPTAGPAKAPARKVVVPAPSPAPTPTPTPAPAPVKQVARPTAAPRVEAAVVPPPVPTTAPTPPPVAIEETILRDSLPTIRDVLHDPERITLGAATAALWFLLVALPGSLLDSAIEKRSHGRMGRALAAVTTTLNHAVDEVSTLARWKLAGPLLVALVAGTAFGFADPHLAWDSHSISTIASLFVALTMITVVASQLGALLARTWWGIDAEVRAEPLGLLAAVAGVGVGRFLSLSPGLFLGLVVGVDAGERADQAHKSKAVVARHTVVFVFAIGAWVAYSLLFGTAPEASAEGGGEGAVGLGPVGGFFSDVLSAMTIEGLTYLITSLLPLPLLPGREVFLHSKRLWGALYAAFAVVFAVLALPSILGEEEHDAGTLVRQGAVMVVFTAVSVVSWIRSRSRTAAPDDLQRV